MFRNINILLSTNWIPIILKVLIKLHIIKCNQFVWFSFYVHSYKLFPFLKAVLKALALENEIFVVNAEYDRQLYSQYLGIPLSKIKLIPFSDGSEAPPLAENLEDYYFAGGYTNRDYTHLIKIFTENKKPLLIVGSHLNPELNINPPSNIRILKDIQKSEFNHYLRHAKACILPLKELTGASGQIVLLAYMKHGKLILAPDTEPIQEMVQHNHSALLFKSEAHLAALIQEIETNKSKDFKELAVQARQNFIRNSSYEGLTCQLSKVLAINDKSAIKKPVLEVA